MEERLFFVGLAMGAFAWLSKRFGESGSLDTAAKTGLWHGLFCGLSAFSAVWVIMMSLDSRARFVGPAAWAVSVTELYPSLAAGAIAAALGFWRGRVKGAAAEGRRYYLNEDLEWAETVFSAVLLASVLMYFVIQAFKIPSGSMRSTLLEGDHLFVNKFIYGLRVPFTGRRVLALREVQRGDIIVFRFPVDDPRELHCGSIQYGKDFIKRVVAVGGDTVQVKGGHLFVNGERVSDEYYAQHVDGPQREAEAVKAREFTKEQYQNYWETHALDRALEFSPPVSGPRDFFGPVTVPPKSFFAMGDNRDRSCDSRYWGPVEQRYLKGRAWFLYWPPSRMKTVL
jgi:signal peptidase I